MAAAKPKIRKWVLSQHAAKRLVERHITIDELNLVLTEPDLVKHQGPKYILAKELFGRRDNLIAAVIIEKTEGNLWVVVTVMVKFQEK